jgi:IS30 family transposase
MEIERLRRQRGTGVRIAHQLGLSHATISRVLRRLKLNRIRDIEPSLPPNRYEHAAPGDMLHLDIKRLVRASWLRLWPGSMDSASASAAC